MALLHINLGNTDIIGQGLCSKGLMVVASKAIPQSPPIAQLNMFTQSLYGNRTGFLRACI